MAASCSEHLGGPLGGDSVVGRCLIRSGGRGGWRGRRGMWSSSPAAAGKGLCRERVLRVRGGTARLLVKKGGQRGSDAARRLVAVARASADMRCCAHAAPVAPVCRGRMLARALWSTIRSMAHTCVLRGPRGGYGARLLVLGLSGERGSRRACPWPAWLGFAMCGPPPRLANPV